MPPADSKPVSAAPFAPDSPPPVVSTHPMITRGKAEISKPCYFIDFTALTSSASQTVLLSHKDLNGFKSAAKHSRWIDAMNTEVQALPK